MNTYTMYRNSFESVIFVYIVAVTINSLIWGFVTKKIYGNKGYEGGFWLGFFLGIIGMIIALCKQDNKSTYTYAGTSSHFEPVVKSENTWKCAKCGRFNSGYSCICGMLKGESELLEKRQQEEKRRRIAEEKRLAEEKRIAEENKAAEKPKADKDFEIINKLKAYKELLDSGAITQEEFDKKKAELLN